MNATYMSIADPSKNGNYTCQVQAKSQTYTFLKDSQIVVLKAKGEGEGTCHCCSPSHDCSFMELSSFSSQNFKASPERDGGDVGVGEELPGPLSL